MTADELREARKGLGLTQKQMAEALNTPFRTYQDWEDEKSRIPGMCKVALKKLNDRQERGVIRGNGDNR